MSEGRFGPAYDDRLRALWTAVLDHALQEGDESYLWGRDFEEICYLAGGVDPTYIRAHSAELRKRKPPERIARPPRECVICGAEFLPINSNHVTCSLECREALKDRTKARYRLRKRQKQVRESPLFSAAQPIEVVNQA